MLKDSELNRIGGEIIGSAYSVRNTYGRLMREEAYEKIMLIELETKGLKVERQKYIDLNHKGVVVPNAYRIDTIVNDSVIVEYKALPKMEGDEFRQIMTYLKLTGLKLGYLINFGAYDFSFGRFDGSMDYLSHGMYRVVNNI